MVLFIRLSLSRSTVGSLIGRRAMWVLHNGTWKVLRQGLVTGAALASPSCLNGLADSGSNEWRHAGAGRGNGTILL